MSTKDEIFDYVMNSPEDTNPSVLKSLLNGIVEGAVINDDTPSTSTVYSSSKVESLIPANELPEVSVNDLAKVLKVSKFTDNTYRWTKKNESVLVLTGYYSNDDKFFVEDTSVVKNDTVIMNHLQGGQPVIAMVYAPYGAPIPSMILTGSTNGTVLSFDGMFRKANSTVYVHIEKTAMFSDFTNIPVTIKEIADPA